MKPKTCNHPVGQSTRSIIPEESGVYHIHMIRLLLLGRSRDTSHHSHFNIKIFIVNNLLGSYIPDGEGKDVVKRDANISSKLVGPIGLNLVA